MSRAQECTATAGVLPPAMPAQVAENLHARLIAAWDRYWFGEIAAIRPYLLMKVLWCMLAFDVWLLRVPRGGSYGAGGFGVAQFGWLDALQPLPSPGLYVGLMLAVGILAVVCALADAGRGARALVALMYTYGWAMSLHDGYQHHYFLSLALTTFVFFPRLRAHDVFATQPKPPVRKRRRARPSEPSTRTVSAWGYGLLGATVGIVYAYTAVTKWDTEWRAGAVMGWLGRRSLGPISARPADAHVPPEMLWVLPSLGVFALECLVAVAYVLAVRLDESGRPWLRKVTWLGLVGAVGFHVSAEVVLGLRIGWFSYYMIALACVFFLPSSVLWGLGALMYRPVAWLAAVGRDFPRGAAVSIGLSTLAIVGAAGVLFDIGRWLDLPGAQFVGALAAAVLVATGAAMLARRRYREAVRYALATGLAGTLMWVAVARSEVRPIYYTDVGTDLKRRGDLAGAVDAFKRARRHAPDDKTPNRYTYRLRRQLDRTEE